VSRPTTLIVEQLRPRSRLPARCVNFSYPAERTFWPKTTRPHSDSDIEIASVVLANLDAQHLAEVTAMAE